MKKNNKGFSLVELIVVIAIMAVIVGVSSLSFGLIFGSQARECAQKVSMQLNATKTGSMSRYDETMKLYATDDGYYIDIMSYTINGTGNQQPVSSAPQTMKVGNKSVAVKVYLTDGTAYTISNTCNVTISYNRATGAQDPARVENGAVVEVGKCVQKLTFQYGKKTYTIQMVPKTGKHTLKAS